MKKWNVIVLSFWLILHGIFKLFNINFSGSDAILAIIELAAGILLFLAGKKIKLFNHFGSLLLAIWLIASGLILLFNISVTVLNIILPILAIVAGIMLPLGVKMTKMTDHIGNILLAVWLVLIGIFALFSIAFSGSGVIVGILGLLAGVFLLIRQ